LDEVDVMGIVSSTGLGSGIDIGSLVSGLVAAERKPAINAITRQEDAINSRLSGLGTLKSALSDFQSVVSKLKDGNLFKTNSAASSNETILKVTAGTGSAAASHTVEVWKLAKAQNLIATTGYASSSSVVTTTAGTLNFTYAAGSSKTAFNVTIGANATLANVRDAINSASGNNGVTASIINVGTSASPISKLVLTSKDTGIANGFDLTVTGGDAGLNALDTASPANYDKVAAEDAEIKVDGLAATVTRSSNSISDVLQGVTLNLQSAAVGTSVKVDVGLDSAAISKTISDFVTAYNKLHTTTQGLGKYGGSTDGSGSGNGALIGDATLRYIGSQLRQDSSNIVSSVTGNYNSLAMIGLKFDKDGVMSLDSTQLNAALSANFQSVSEVFSSSNGVATRLYGRLNDFLQSGGPLDSQQTSLKKRLSGLEDRRVDVEARLDAMQASLLKQFTAMDTAVGQFKATGTFLTNWISKL
jgi:flagellar hook-associated protein 2